VRVLHVLQHSLPTLYGYTIRAQGIMSGQIAHGLSVSAVTGAVEQGSTVPEEVINGITYWRTPNKGLRYSTPGLREWELVQRLEKRILEVAAAWKPDIIHVHSPAYNGSAALAAARKLNLPCLYEMRAVWEDAAVDRRKFGASSILYSAARALESRVIRRAHALVGICEGLRKEILSRGVPPGRVFVVPNAVEVEQFQRRPRDQELAASLGLKSGPVFGFLGSLFTYEGVEDLLDVMPRLLAAHPEASLLVVGGGERQSQVRQRIEKLGSPSIIYQPRVPHSEIAAYYSVVDCLVYPRRSVRLTELVTPLKPLEAMAMGKALIASDIGGHRELIQHGVTGLLYKAESAGCLLDELRRAASDPDLLARLGEQGREYVRQNRTWTSVTAQYVEIYQTCRGAHRAA